MKKILVLLGFIGVINVTALNSSARLLNPKKKINDEYLAGILAPVAPMFIQLDGNVFLAVKTPGQLTAADGDVVEFIFDNKARMISFHINDSNQNLIDTNTANLFVMIHHDLALMLKSTRLKEINVVRGENLISSISVNSFWIPGQNIVTL